MKYGDRINQEIAAIGAIDNLARQYFPSSFYDIYEKHLAEIQDMLIRYKNEVETDDREHPF